MEIAHARCDCGAHFLFGQPKNGAANTFSQTAARDLIYTLAAKIARSHGSSKMSAGQHSFLRFSLHDEAIQ